MRCLVTGVAGFIGSSIAERLIAQGATVVGIDCFTPYYGRNIKEGNLSALLSSPKFKFTEGLIQKTDLSEVCKDIEWVFHQAAQAGVRSSWGSEFETYTSHNVLATQMLLEALKRIPTVKKVVYASSSSVYGDAEAYPTSESLLPKPISPYGVSKLAGEHLMELYRSQFNVPTTSLRYFTVFGPRQRPDMAFHKFIRAGLKGEAIPLYGDGEQERDFTFIEDVVDSNILAAEKGIGVYNIGGGTHAKVTEVLQFLEKEIGTLNIDRQPKQVGDARKTSADTTRARKELSFSPKVGLHDGLRAEIEWLRGII